MTIRHIALITDAWAPQVNGVVRTLSMVVEEWRKKGLRVSLITPDQFRTLPCPTYPEIRLALTTPRAISKRLDALAPDAIHIATEGPLGLSARLYCAKRKYPFTTSFHTRFPEYIAARYGRGEGMAYRYLRWFHNHSHAMMVATPSLKSELEGKGFIRCQLWMRGVDTALFHPNKREELPYERPIWLYVGRVAPEKNIVAFITLDLPGTKLVIGDGPLLSTLKYHFTQVHFLGAKQGDELAKYYASADAFIFPSVTDTYGLVMLEALASGTPVGAFPVTGPKDVLTDPLAACLDVDLLTAAQKAVLLSREAARQFSLNFSWEECARLLEEALIPARSNSDAAI